MYRVRFKSCEGLSNIVGQRIPELKFIVEKETVFLLDDACVCRKKRENEVVCNKRLN